MKSKPETVSAYIAAMPRPHQARLRKLRATIRAAAPKAEERISYSMPFYYYKGRLAYFMLATNHVGLYIPPPVIQEHPRELKGYVTSKATVQLPFDTPLPVALVRKLIRARAAWNERKEAKRK